MAGISLAARRGIKLLAVSLIAACGPVSDRATGLAVDAIAAARLNDGMPTVNAGLTVQIKFSSPEGLLAGGVVQPNQLVRQNRTCYFGVGIVGTGGLPVPPYVATWSGGGRTVTYTSSASGDLPPFSVRFGPATQVNVFVQDATGRNGWTAVSITPTPPAPLNPVDCTIYF